MVRHGTPSSRPRAAQTLHVSLSGIWSLTRDHFVLFQQLPHTISVLSIILLCCRLCACSFLVQQALASDNFVTCVFAPFAVPDNGIDDFAVPTVFHTYCASSSSTMT